ncbi:hypothetical protein C7B69_13565 [filamentous cyanobacterium Phorm 46]|nr:hypothetical protein C7B69_13565 [filamentous cyanobacterium Phorm 46]PSB47218.1 hypothetical protein C7B67_19320 [filamentous cyanobacterium Phorm 6]
MIPLASPESKGDFDALVPPESKGGAREIEGLIIRQQTLTTFDVFVDTNSWYARLTVRIFGQVLHIIL